MKRQYKSYALKSFILLIALLFTSTGAFGDGLNERTKTVIADNLSQKLRRDLGDNSVTVKIGEIDKHLLSQNTADIEGTAYAVSQSENTRLPLRFEARVNARTNDVADIAYVFVEESAEYAPASTEEVLMKELMKQVSVDYKTDSITIAIDGFESIETANGREYKGVGEIKINEIEWSEINFDVVLDGADKASKIKYDIK